MHIHSMSAIIWQKQNFLSCSDLELQTTQTDGWTEGHHIQTYKLVLLPSEKRAKNNKTENLIHARASIGSQTQISALLFSSFKTKENSQQQVEESRIETKASSLAEF
jgi:hypothetical protein